MIYEFTFIEEGEVPSLSVKTLLQRLHAFHTFYKSNLTLISSTDVQKCPDSVS